MTEEQWKTIPKFSKYQVSTLGRVKALAYTFIDSLGRCKHCKERILSTKTRYRNGKIDYTKVKLVDDDGIVKNLYVHRLVAEVFIPNPENLPEVNHIGLNKSNNCVSNLEWVTKLQNSQRCIQRPHPGMTNGNAKLTDELVLLAREKRAAGATYVSIAKFILDNYNIHITPEQISNVVNKQWRHL